MKNKKHTKITILFSSLLLIAAILTACTLGMNSALTPDNDNDGSDGIELKNINTDDNVTVTISDANALTVLDWRMAAVEFLDARPSIFGFDWAGNNNPDVRITYDYAPNDGIFSAGYIYYDEGNIIDEDFYTNGALFLKGEAPWQMLAMDYYLIDFDDSGIPALVVMYAMPETGGGFPCFLYFFNDGMYYEYGEFISPQFFRNENGNIIMFEWRNYEDDLRVSRLTPLGAEGYMYDLLADWSEFSVVDVNKKTPALFDMLGESLVSIEHLDALKESITESVMHKNYR